MEEIHLVSWKTWLVDYSTILVAKKFIMYASNFILLSFTHFTPNGNFQFQLSAVNICSMSVEIPCKGATPS